MRAQINVQRLWLLQQLSSLGTLSAVAEVEGLSRPAVSQQLAQLERETGLSLLVRGSKRVSLSPAAVRLLDRSQELFEQVEAVVQHLEQHNSGAGGELRLAGFSSVLSTLVPRALAALQKAHPALRVSLQELEPRLAVAELTAGTIDIALVHDFRFEQTDRRLIDPVPFYIDQVFMVVPGSHRAASRHAVSLSLFASDPWAINDAAGTYADFVTELCASHGFAPHVIGRFEQISTVLAMVRAGLAVTLLPGLALHNMPAGVTAVPLAEPVLRRTHLAYRKGRQHSAAFQASVEALRSVAKAFEQDRAQNPPIVRPGPATEDGP